MNHTFIEHREKYRDQIVQRYGVTNLMFDIVNRMLEPLAVPVSLRKGEYLQRSGAPAQWVYWLYSGVARNGFVTEAGNEVTLRFTMDGELAASQEDLLAARDGIPAVHFVVAETAVEGFRIDWAEINRLADQDEVMRAYYLRVSENAIVRQSRRLFHSMASAQGRLEAFRQEYPGLESRISQKVMASFLGITPQYMSQLLRNDSAVSK